MNDRLTFYMGAIVAGIILLIVVAFAALTIVVFQIK